MNPPGLRLARSLKKLEREARLRLRNLLSHSLISHETLGFSRGMMFAPTMYNGPPEASPMQPSTHAVTADELLNIPDDGFLYELASGELIRMPPPFVAHGVVAMRIGAALADWADRERRGLVLAAETGVHLTRNPDTVRAPDAAFIRRERIPAAGLPHGYWPGAPDLAVEVLSPDDSRAEVGKKVREYLSNGARLVWVIDPVSRCVTAHRPGSSSPQVIAEAEMLEGEAVLPGLRFPVARLFEGIAG